MTFPLYIHAHGIAFNMRRLWQQQGKCTDAHQLLAEVYGWCTEGFDTADLQEAKRTTGYVREKVAAARPWRCCTLLPTGRMREITLRGRLVEDANQPVPSGNVLRQ